MNYRRWSTRLLNWFEAVCSSWDMGVHLQPHDHGGAQGFIFLLWGELHESRWEEKDGRLILIERTIMKGPAFGYIKATDVHDVCAVKKSYAAQLYFPVPRNVKVFQNTDH